MGDFVGAGDVQVRVDQHAGLRPQPVSDPAQAQVLDAPDTGGGVEDVAGGGAQLGVHGVHQAPVHLASGVAQDDQDGDGDEESDDRVGDRESEQGAGGAADDGQRGEPVGAGVVSVGHQGGGPDALADPDPVAG